MESFDTIVIGGGQAGLAAGYHLQRAGLNFAILEADHEATGSWKHYYDSLKIFSPAYYSSLPGMRFPGTPDRYPTRDEVVDYLRVYAKHFALPIKNHTQVEHVEKHADVFHIFTNQGKFTAGSIIAATGAFSRPNFPQFENQAAYAGRILHSSAYRDSQPFQNQRVLIVGAGNSAVQIAVELAKTAQVTLTSRDPLRFWRQRFLGRDLHFWLRITGFDNRKQLLSRWDPLKLNQPGVLDTGVYQTAFKSGNPTYHLFFKHFTEQGVQWADDTVSAFDSVIFATGFRPNLPYLAALGALDENGNALQNDGISTRITGLYFVGIAGQRSFASATLRGVGADAAYVINDLKRYLSNPDQYSNQVCCVRPQPTGA